MTMIKDVTCFNHDAIGIDPSGCGCTDCCVRDSIPEDDTDAMQEVFRQMMEESRPIVNRTGIPFVVYRSTSGYYVHHSMYGDENATRVVSHANQDYYFASSKTNEVIIINDDTTDEEVEAIAEKAFDDDVIIVNNSDNTLVFVDDYGDYRVDRYFDVYTSDSFEMVTRGFHQV